MERLEHLLSQQPFFAGLKPAQIELIAGCGRNTHFKAGEMLLRIGDPADEFFLVREGAVRIEVPSPRLGPITIETIHAGGMLGWSWLIPPYRWHFDAQAVDAVRATALDGRCLRGKFEGDPALGYAIMQRFAGVILQRLQSTTLRFIEAVESAAESRSA